jgi:hypothetical protein
MAKLRKTRAPTSTWVCGLVGKHRAGDRCDVLVTDQLLQFSIGVLGPNHRQY